MSSGFSSPSQDLKGSHCQSLQPPLFPKKWNKPVTFDTAKCSNWPDPHSKPCLLSRYTLFCLFAHNTLQLSICFNCLPFVLTCSLQYSILTHVQRLQFNLLPIAWTLWLKSIVMKIETNTKKFTFLHRLNIGSFKTDKDNDSYSWHCLIFQEISHMFQK
jgi:hypothetical protein